MNKIRQQCSLWYEQFLALPRGEQFFKALFWGFFFHLLFFPGGFGIREIMPVFCAVMLCAYYRYAWRQSNLYMLTARWLFLPYLVLLVVAVAFSLDPLNSLLHIGRGLNKQLLIPFIAMECVRDEKDLRRLLWALVLACLWEGFDCIFQSMSGFDFIHGAGLHSNRLTGSMGDYWVGNYFALALTPVFGLWCLLRQRFSRATTLLLCAALLAPALYGMVFSGVRNALLTLAAITAFAWLYAWSVRWKGLFFSAVCILLCAVAVVWFYDTHRLSMESISGDGRWDLWHFALAVWREYPWFGAGAGEFNTAFRSLGLVPLKDAITISHPHDIYLQLLCETGVVGLSLALTSLLGLLVWVERNMRPFLKEECRKAWGIEQPRPIYWRLTFFFWLGYVAFFINGIVGHDFFRPWYQLLVFGHLGIAMGAVLAGLRRSRQKE